MFDPRDDARDRDGRDDGRARVYDARDRDDDLREGLMRHLDLPRGEERELVALRDHVYELDGEDSRTLAAVGAFRVVPEHDLDIDHDTLNHLRDEGLIETVDLGDEERGLTLTREGRDLLDSHSMDREANPHRRSTPASAVNAKSNTTRTSTRRTARRKPGSATSTAGSMSVASCSTTT